MRSTPLIALAVGGLLLLFGGSAMAADCPPEFGLPAGAVCDLTGELCLAGSAEVGGATYCLMQGRIPIGTALEMDDIFNDLPSEGNTDSVRDANVFGGDPGCVPPGNICNDPDLPQVAGATYIDWNDLPLANTTDLDVLPNGKPLGSVENNRILDFTANSDYTIFGKDSCLVDGSALPKEDFTQSYLANNDQFLYFAQERRTNNGNSVYYWMLTKMAPTVAQDPTCGSNTRGQIQFTLSDGDVQVLVNFPSSSDPAGGAVFFRRYIGPTSASLAAVDAVFAAGWETTLTPVLNFALNVNDTGTEGDDLLPDWGGINKRGFPFAQDGMQYYTTASFAEWAIDLGLLFAGGPVCGEELFVTGVSRASTGQVGKITEPSDLKDLVGPKLFSFGDITATAALAPVCDPANGIDYVFDYSATATGIDNQPIDPADLSCSWSCTSVACDDPMLNDPNACSGTGSIARSGGAAGAGPCDISCTVSVEQISSGCVDDDTAVDDVLAPILVDIAPDAGALTCTVPGSPGFDNGNIGPGVTYTATASGGDLQYDYTWTVNGPNASSCGPAASCNVDIPDGNFCALTTLYVSVDDGSVCPAVASETEAVDKFTMVNATDAP